MTDRTISNQGHIVEWAKVNGFALSVDVVKKDAAGDVAAWGESVKFYRSPTSELADALTPETLTPSGGDDEIVTIELADDETSTYGWLVDSSGQLIFAGRIHHVEAGDPRATVSTDPIVVQYVDGTTVEVTFAGGGGVSYPSGGTTGQALVKASGDDDDVEWATVAGSGDMLGSNNLSDVDSAATSRDNLGLGDSATLDVGTTSGTVAAGDDSRLSDARTPTAHTHTMSDVTDAGDSSTLDVGTGSGTVAAGNHTHSDYEAGMVALGAAISQAEGDIDDLEDAAVPSGGADGQVLTKTSGTDYDMAWEDSAGGGSATTKQVYFFTAESTLETGNGSARLPILSDCTITSVMAMVGSAPTGSSVIADVNLNGTTIFTTQGNRPEIAVSAQTSDAETPDVTEGTAGDYLSMDVDQVGSSSAGSDLVVAVEVTVP